MWTFYSNVAQTLDRGKRFEHVQKLCSAPACLGVCRQLSNVNNACLAIGKLPWTLTNVSQRNGERWACVGLIVMVWRHHKKHSHTWHHPESKSWLTGTYRYKSKMKNGLSLTLLLVWTYLRQWIRQYVGVNLSIHLMYSRNYSLHNSDNDRNEYEVQ